MDSTPRGNGQLPGKEPVGLVVGTVAATPLQFSVAISAEQYLQLDDVVVTQRSPRMSCGISAPRSSTWAGWTWSRSGRPRVMVRRDKPALRWE